MGVVSVGWHGYDTSAVEWRRGGCRQEGKEESREGGRRGSIMCRWYVDVEFKSVMLR